MEKLIIEIHNPLDNPHEKMIEAMIVLSKALKSDFILEDEGKVEPTPYKALRQLADQVYIPVHDGLLNLFSEISKKWLRLEMRKAAGDPYKLNGKIFINPKTGKPLTVGEWKAIQKDLTKVFSYLYGNTQEAMVKNAIAMGKILQRMEPDDRLDADSKDLDIDTFSDSVSHDNMYRNIIDWAKVNTGELIQDVTTRSRRAIVSTIMQGYQDKIESKELQTRLFDKFSQLNRDWRRIAETETATNFNNGYLTSELEQRKELDEEDKPLFMIGISGAGACDFCRTQVDGKIVVVLENPPAKGDSVTVDGEDYTAVWPGKNNFGRKQANWWVSSGSQHPHCRCTWTKYDLRFAEYEKKIREATGN